MPEPVRSDETRSALAILNALQISVLVGRLYPDPMGQPGFVQALDTLAREINPERTERFAVEISRGEFFLKETELPGSGQAVNKMATTLFEHGVRELVLRAAPNADEVIAFSELLSADRTTVAKEGGPREFLKKRGVSSFVVVERDLTIGRPGEVADEGGMPEPLSLLLRDHQGAAETMELLSSSVEVYSQLEALVEEGAAFGLRSEVEQGAADTIAAMSDEYRRDIIDTAIGKSSDPFAVTVTGQLSDSELIDSLIALAPDKGLEMVLSYAEQVVRHSKGMRAELPVSLGRRLIEEGFDRSQVLRKLGTERLLGDTPGLTLQDVEDDGDIDLEELRREVMEVTPENEFEVGLKALRGLLQTQKEPMEFEQVVDLAEASIRRWVNEASFDRVVAAIEMLDQEASAETNPERRERLMRAAATSSSVQALEAFLMEPRVARGPHTKKLVSLMGRRGIPALLDIMAREEEAAKRKLIVTVLSDAAKNDLRSLVEALDDPRWYVARNIVGALGLMHTDDAVPHLIRASRHADPRVRREALRALVGTTGQATESRLQWALKDSDQSVRLTALAALAAMKSPEATKDLLSFIQMKPTPNIRELREALDSLAFQGTELAMAALKALSTSRFWMPRWRKELARHAQQVLTRVGGSDG